MSVLAAIAVLALLIVVHELGHFMAARLQGIHANRFSIGFGPILWKYQGRETEYAIRAFPLGGFVGFPDDDPDSPIPPDDPNLLGNRPLLDRAIVISAGVIANLVFAYLVLVLQVGTVGIQQTSQPGVLIRGILAPVAAVSPQAAQAGVQVGDTLLVDQNKFSLSYDASRATAELILSTQTTEPVPVFLSRKDESGKPQEIQRSLSPQILGQGGQLGIFLEPTVAVQAGLQPGDVVLAIGGDRFNQSLRSIQTFQTAVREHPDQPLPLTVQRGQQTLALTIQPRTNPDGEGSIGVALSPNGKIVRDRVAGVAVFTAAAEEFQGIVNDTVEGFGRLIQKFSKVADQVAGPVAIVAVGAKLVQSDAASLFQFAALISINLAIINILPLPALDGGHLAFLLIEGVRGKPLPSKIQDGVMQTGLVLLLGLGIFLIIRDTANLIPQ